jgi:hypothetical protein
LNTLFSRVSADPYRCSPGLSFPFTLCPLRMQKPIILLYSSEMISQFSNAYSDLVFATCLKTNVCNMFEDISEPLSLRSALSDFRLSQPLSLNCVRSSAHSGRLSCFSSLLPSLPPCPRSACARSILARDAARVRSAASPSAKANSRWGSLGSSGSGACGRGTSRGRSRLASRAAARLQEQPPLRCQAQSRHKDPIPPWLRK